MRGDLRVEWREQLRAAAEKRPAQARPGGRSRQKGCRCVGTLGAARSEQTGARAERSRAARLVAARIRKVHHGVLNPGPVQEILVGKPGDRRLQRRPLNLLRHRPAAAKLFERLLERHRCCEAGEARCREEVSGASACRGSATSRREETLGRNSPSQSLGVALRRTVGDVSDPRKRGCEANAQNPHQRPCEERTETGRPSHHGVAMAVGADAPFTLKCPLQSHRCQDRENVSLQEVISSAWRLGAHQRHFFHLSSQTAPVGPHRTTRAQGPPPQSRM